MELRTAACLGLAGIMCALVGQNTSRRDAYLQDLAYARENYVLATHSFAPAAREQAQTLIRDLEGRAGNLSDLDFLVGIQRVTAFAGNAHDDIRLSDGAWSPSGRLPLRLIWFPDALIIARAGAPITDLAGARVAAIEGLRPEALLNRLKPLCGGNENFCRWRLTWAIEYQGVLSALGIAQSADQLHFDLVLRNGKKVDRIIAMVPSKAVPAMRPTRLWSGELTADEAAAGWRTAIDPKIEPLYLQDADEPFRLQDLPAVDAWYLQFRVNRDLGSYHIQTFAQQALAKIRAHPRGNLIVDLRFDVGGDITRTRDVMRQLTNAVPGHTYLLVGRYTFSAGIVASAILKSAGRDKVEVVGEGLGDRLRWWSEGHEVCLPNSRICLSMTDGLWDLSKGCTAEPACYGDRITGPVGSLDPEVLAPLTAAAWISDQDPAMEKIEAELAKTRGN